ncbi:hypothetical protein GCM10025859_09530 [Alicyclobacillus fastidiosus]|nr:hypothetical protein GCM10025859_09530 [Alicyclobacillus fastidiosus]
MAAAGYVRPTDWGIRVQEQTHRKPGHPLRKFDIEQVSERDKENVSKFGVQTTVENTSRKPTPEDGLRMVTAPKRTTPID